MSPPEALTARSGKIFHHYFAPGAGVPHCNRLWILAIDLMTANLLVDYLMHDAVYRRLRESGASGWGRDEEVRFLFDQVLPLLPPLPPVASLLELGCGAGNLSLMLAARGYNVTGVDIAPTAIQWAIERAQSARVAATFTAGDVVTLGQFADSAFDAVVDGHCLHCVIGTYRAQCLRAVHRVLRPDGTFVVATMCGEVVDDRLRKLFDPQSSTVMIEGRPTRHIGKADDVVAEVAIAGFDIVSVNVVARRDPTEQDDLFILARRPSRGAWDH